MSTDNNLLINDLSYVDNLNNIPTTASPSVMGVNTVWPTFIIMNFTDSLINGSGSTKTSNFFKALGKSIPMPTTYDEFIAAFSTYTGLSTSYEGRSFLSYFMDDFSTVLHDPYASGGTTAANAGIVFNTSPWRTYFQNNAATLPTTTNSDWPLSTPSPTSMINQFKAWFADFLNNYPRNADGSIVTDDLVNGQNSFTQRMGLELANIVTLSSDKTGLLYRSFASGGSANVITISPPLNSYQDIYKALFPSASTADFKTRLQAFYDATVAEKGYFIPGQAFSDWTQTLQSEFLKSLNVPTDYVLQESSLASAGFQKTLILDRVFLLVSKMLESLQRVAAVQAQRLTLMTQWQAAYTQKISQLPVFLASQTPETRLTNASGDSTDTKNAKADARDDLNNKVNFNLRDLMQTRRNAVSDAAKGLQSNINQSTDAVSQQANIATAIIQELTTLLSAIYR